MALQTSGSISISQIKAEVGSSSNSLRTLSAAAGFSTPDAMSEFYGYSSYSNDEFYRNDGINDYIQYDGADGSLIFGETPITVSFWVRQNSEIHKNAQMLNFAPGFSSNDRIMIDYNKTNSKLRFNHRADGTNTMKEYYLGSNPDTGVRSEWTVSDPGVVNALGFNMLTYVYDPSQSGLDGLTVYWNETPLNHQAYVQGTRSNLPVVNARVGENIHTTASAGCANMDFDEIKIFAEILSQDDITTLYNGGDMVSNSQLGIPNLFTEIDFEGEITDSAIYWPNNGAFNGGALAAY